MLLNQPCTKVAVLTINANVKPPPTFKQNAYIYKLYQSLSKQIIGQSSEVVRIIRYYIFY